MTLADDIERLQYIAGCLEAHADKFPVPGHMEAHAAFLREQAALRATEAQATDADQAAAENAASAANLVTCDGYYEFDLEALTQVFANHATQAAAQERAEIVALALAAQPSTAENPNEDAYQRGRFDGIMEYAKAIAALNKEPKP